MYNLEKFELKLIQIITETYQREGFWGFYSGFRVDMIRILPQNAIMFVCYEWLKSHLTLIALRGKFTL